MKLNDIIVCKKEYESIKINDHCTIVNKVMFDNGYEYIISNDNKYHYIYDVGKNYNIYNHFCTINEYRKLKLNRILK